MKLRDIILALNLGGCAKHIDPDDTFTNPRFRWGNPLFKWATDICATQGAGTYNFRYPEYKERELFYITNDLGYPPIGTLECRINSFKIIYTDITPTETSTKTCKGVYNRPKKMKCRSNSDSEQNEEHVKPMKSYLDSELANTAISICKEYGSGTLAITKNLRETTPTGWGWNFGVAEITPDYNGIGTLECRTDSFEIIFTDVTPTETCRGVYNRPKEMRCTRNNSDSEQKEGQ